MEAFIIHDGAQCHNTAANLEEAYPDILEGKMQDVNMAIVIAFNGFCKPVSARGKSRGALRPGEQHGKPGHKRDDEPELRRQIRGAMHLASRARMFRHVAVSCVGTGAIWKIDSNENIKNYDEGRNWDGWTKIAMQCFQAHGIPVFPCVKALR